MNAVVYRFPGVKEKRRGLARLDVTSILIGFFILGLVVACTIDTMLIGRPVATSIGALAGLICIAVIVTRHLRANETKDLPKTTDGRSMSEIMDGVLDVPAP